MPFCTFFPPIFYPSCVYFAFVLSFPVKRSFLKRLKVVGKSFFDVNELEYYIDFCLKKRGSGSFDSLFLKKNSDAKNYTQNPEVSQGPIQEN